MKKITNARLKEIRRLLRDKKEREKTGLFAVEGAKIISDMIAKGRIPEFMTLAADKDLSYLAKKAEKMRIPLYSSSAADLEKISSLETSSGAIAVFKKGKEPQITFTSDGQSLFVLLDGVQDPGNVGSIVRNAAAFGASGVILAGECADIYNPKTIRSSAGAVFDLAIFRREYAWLDEARKKGYKLIVSRSSGEGCAELGEIKRLPRPLIVAFGSEGKGVSENVKNRADAIFNIPISAETESLNVASAVAITLYELQKQ